MTTMEQGRSSEVRTQVIVDAPVEKTFRVFTQKAHTWWPLDHRLGKTARTAVVLEPFAGGRWYEQTDDGAECDWGRVLAWEPPHHVALSWMIGVGFVPETDPDRASRVDVRFEASGSRTVVTLVHSGIERHGEGWESLHDGVAGAQGWPGILERFAVVAGS